LFVFSIEPSIFAFGIPDNRKLLTLLLEIPKPGTFSLYENFGSPIIGFLITKFPSISNENPSFLFVFSSVNYIDLSFFFLSAFKHKLFFVYQLSYQSFVLVF
jgi:hypothetical protein